MNRAQLQNCASNGGMLPADGAFTFAKNPGRPGRAPVANEIKAEPCSIRAGAPLNFYNFKSASVTAPSEALVTWAAYLASTPRV
jgi:hypothetical protein